MHSLSVFKNSKYSKFGKIHYIRWEIWRRSRLVNHPSYIYIYIYIRTWYKTFSCRYSRAPRDHTRESDEDNNKPPVDALLFICLKKKIVIILNVIRFHCKRQTLDENDEMPQSVRYTTLLLTTRFFPRHVPTARERIDSKANVN